MNSLQYISTQVDSLIGNHRDAEPYPLGVLDEEALYKEDPVEEDKPKELVPESVLVSVMLYVPRMVYFVLAALLTPLEAKASPRWLRPATPLPEDVPRRLQSPYGKSVRLPRAHKGDPQRILFPSRPLLPRHAPPKTLVLDLDETLVHSLSRSSKFSQGQMVEIKLDPTQLATLYLVNKRPFCDQFLQAVSQWYRLVVFTASVQAYADPMIDWLEQDRKYFHRRLYRHHCTQSPGGYVKDLALVEPDLSRVLIIDNSPVSYTDHKENAIGIEGWVSDPSDHALLNLVPLLNALRYATDVRSLLSLKRGEDAFAD